MNLKFKKLYLYMIVFTLIFISVLSGCSQNGNSESDTEEQIGTVTMSITGYDNLAQFEETEITITEGMTALDALYETEFTIDASDGFVNSIDGLTNGSIEEYPYCGWVYYINGDFAEKSAAEQVLKDGDKLEWKFSLTFD